jgi:TetR/AcrR family transcriptional regulator, regulator of cefoperazone and chloramphenicol sensitivity
MSADTKEKIIQATLEIIGNDGIYKVTIRKIAELSGVNVASLNYHFGSKETLIQETMKYFGKQMIDIFSILENVNDTSEEKLEQFVMVYTENILKHPGVIKSIIMQVISGDVKNELLFELIKKGSRLLQGIFLNLSEKKDERIAMMKAVQLMSSIIYPVIWDEYMVKLFDIDYQNKKNREQYLEIALNDFMSSNK